MISYYLYSRFSKYSSDRTYLVFLKSHSSPAIIPSRITPADILLPTVNVYTNILGECNLNIIDSTQVKELPSFVIGNGTEFLKAHRYSQTSNNLTIRLDDIKVDGLNVSLHTSRTYYFHMLLTNRCMDYKLDCDMSVREIYEFNKTISYLRDSKLSNQIGINGMIITKDGYLLIEKRDHRKTTWKRTPTAFP